MIKKILFYVAAFAVSLVFARNVYASDDLIFSSTPEMTTLNAETPVVFSASDFDYTNGYFDNNSGYKMTSSYEFSSSSDLSKLFDNSLKTFLKSNISNGGESTYFKIALDDPVVVNAFYFSMYYGSFSFYDSNNKLIYTYTNSPMSSKTGKYVSFPSTTPVKYIKFFNATTSGYWSSFYEFEIFGDVVVYTPITQITSTVTDVTATLNWVIPLGIINNLDHINVDGVDVGKSTTYLMKNLKANTNYTVSLELVFKDGVIVNTDYSFMTSEEKDIIPPSEVSDFKGSPDKTFVDLTWSLPSDADYEKLLLYRDNVLIKTLTTETNYKDEKLNEDTTYKYKIITVDKTGNKSEGKIITVLTKFTQTNLPPDEPLGLNAKPLSKGVKLSWKNPTSGSVKGYKIYMFEKDVASNNILDKFVITAQAAPTPTEVSTGLVSSTSYQVSGLQNGTTYGFYIIAVNSSGLSSVPSNTVYATPTINSVPPVNIGGGGSGSNGSNNAGFALSDVTSGVSTWFGGIWLILAFAIGIMVSFIIANRIKKLFVA